MMPKYKEKLETAQRRMEEAKARMEKREGSRQRRHSGSSRPAFLGRHLRRSQRGNKAHDHCPAGGADRNQP